MPVKVKVCGTGWTYLLKPKFDGVISFASDCPTLEKSLFIASLISDGEEKENSPNLRVLIILVGCFTLPIIRFTPFKEFLIFPQLASTIEYILNSQMWPAIQFDWLTQWIEP